MNKQGGCDKDTRGQASIDRSNMEASNTRNSSDYKAYSATIHCQNGNTSNCSNQKNVEPILGKYTK